MKLNEVCKFIIDCPHSTAVDEGEGYPLIRTPNVGRGRLILDNVHRVSEATYNKRNFRAVPQAGDLIFAREAPAGNVALIKKGQKVCLGQRTVLIRPDRNKVDAGFLAYYILSPEQQYKLLGSANGATVAHINLPIIRELTVDLPELPIQKKISKILSDYDDLIENNQKQIKLLEEAAQRLYKEWFVNLRFPGHEIIKIVDGVPKGWCKEEVGNIIGNIKRTTQIQTSDYKQEGKIPVIDQSRDYIAGYTDDETAIIDEKEAMIVFGDHTRILKYVPFPFAKGADGTQIIVSIEERMPQNLLYWSLININLSNFHYARHFKYLKKSKILVPTKALALQFNSFVNPIMNEIQKLREVTYYAIKARDLLLPRLMKGEIEV